MSEDWRPYCGAEYAGLGFPAEPVVCDRETHPHSEVHTNEEHEFAWWEYMSYPRSGGR